MQFHTFFDNVAVKTSFDGALTNATQNGAGVDCFGYRRAGVIINAFTGSATTFNYTVSESSDNSTFTTVPTATLGAAVAASTADAGSFLLNIDLAKRKRYLRVDIIGTGAAGNAVALILLAQPYSAAVSQDRTVISV